MNQGKFTKQFNTFKDGLRELCSVSESAKQALNANQRLHPAINEETAVAQLAANIRWARPTGNGYGWGQCKLQIEADKVTYQTTGGLRFGWEVDSSDYQEYRECYESPASHNKWTFFLQHPDQEKIRPNSTLRESAITRAWEES